MIRPKHFGWMRQVFTLEIRKLMSYRVDFWSQFLGTIIAQIVAAYFLWKAIFDYRGVDELGGYSFGGLMLYYLLVPLVSYMIRGPEMGFMSQEIYDGTLNRYLIYPVSFFNYKFVAHLAASFMYSLQFILGLVLFVAIFGIPDGITISVTSLGMGFSFVLLAAYLYFVMASNLELIAFWADNVWSLLVLQRFFISLFGGAWIPLSFFPGWAQKLLDLLPYSYLASFPIRCFLGQISWQAWGLGLVVIVFWALFFTGVMRIVWRRGNLKYTGVGI